MRCLVNCLSAALMFSVITAICSSYANAQSVPVPNGSFDEVGNWVVSGESGLVIVTPLDSSHVIGVPWALSPDGGSFGKLTRNVDAIIDTAIQQPLSGFDIGATYILEFYQSNLGSYLFGQWNRDAGYFDIFIDNIFVGSSTTINAPGNYDDPLEWGSEGVTFVASAQNHFLKIVAKMADGKTVDMGIDGVRIRLVTAEICDNGIDDDSDGLVDVDDPDCRTPSEGEGLFVRCMHKPVYPQLGDIVTITAEAIGSNGYPVVPDFIEIYVGQMDSPFGSVIDQSVLTATFEANTGQLSYGCRAGGVGNDISEAHSWRALDRKLRSVDVGSPNNPDWKAIPIIYNGQVNEKIDIVLFHDDDEYTAFDDPEFLEDVHTLIDGGLFTIPWFVEHQWAFNVWIATADTANASPKPSGGCARDAPDRIEEDYSYRNAGGIVHKSSCRDNASPAQRMFTVEMLPSRLQVYTHEVGHAAFGLADEYCTSDATVCDGGYFESNPPFSNVFATETNCQDDAINQLRRYEPSACRSITSTDSDGVPDGKIWWIGEPDYRSGVPALEQIGDLMQQTGKIEDAAGNRLDRYQVGDSGSETDRLNSQVWGVCTRDKRC